MRPAVFMFVGFLTACSGNGISTTARAVDATVGDVETESGDVESSNTSDDPSGPMTSTSGVAPTESVEATTSGEATGGDAGPSDTTESDDPVSIVGTWISQGDDIAPVFTDPTAPTQLTYVEAVFEDNAYTVSAQTVDGDTLTLTGTYAVMPSGVGGIMNIVLEQSTPVTSSYEGIYAIDQGTQPPSMRYEVTQTAGLGWEPGLVPPTAEAGFGSSQPAGADNIQIYVWAG